MLLFLLIASFLAAGTLYRISRAQARNRVCSFTPALKIKRGFPAYSYIYCAHGYPFPLLLYT
jgi:hypothetical protein